MAIITIQESDFDRLSCYYQFTRKIIQMQNYDSKLFVPKMKMAAP